MVEDARAQFQRDIADAVDLTERLVDRIDVFGRASRIEAFRSIDRALVSTGPDHGIVIFQDVGRVARQWAWGGVLRVPPGQIGPPLGARMTAFYVLLEARRQDENRTFVSQVVLAADSAVPDRSQTLAAQFAQRTGVGLVFHTELPEGEAPWAVFCQDSCEPAGAMPVDTIIFAELIPPSQGTAKLDALSAGEQLAVSVLAVGLVVLLLTGGLPARWIGLLGLAGLLLFTASGRLLGMQFLFSTESYFLEWLGPFSDSAGALLVAAVVVTAFMMHRIQALGPYGVLGRFVALGLVIAAPWVLTVLSNGITPPATGISTLLWLSWQVPLALVGVALGLAAGKALGASVLPHWSIPVLGAAGAVLLGLWGVTSWQPFTGWSSWYPAAWVVVALLAIQGTSRARVAASATVVAGAAAAVLVWSAEVESRLVLAERDAGRVDEGDAFAISQLDRFGDVLMEGAVPRAAATLYAQWSRSQLSLDDYPAVLDSWDPFGARIASLELAELPITATRRARLASSARLTGQPKTESIALENGIHYLAAVPFRDGSAVTIALGPRSRLISPVLVARFLRGERRLEAPYELSLGETVAGPATDVIDWSRTGPAVRGSRVMQVDNHRARHLHVVVPLRETMDITVRGILVVLVNGLIVLLVAALSAGMMFGLRVPQVVRSALSFGSYRVQLTVALAGFFVLPTLGFAVWSLNRIRTEADRSRDLVIQGTLSEATEVAQQTRTIGIEGVGLDVIELGNRLGNDLLLYEDGVLTQYSAPVLGELGLLGPFLQASVFEEFAFRDGLELNTNLVIGGQPTRVGYRSVEAENRAAPVLAAPQLVDVGGLQREREDLALSVLLVTLLGVAGAAGLAAVAARSLSKPVQSLRAAAVAVGQGETLPAFDPNVPAEFGPVMDAFVRMAHDVDRSQRALEAARRRTATVLANVATGVVAVDTDLRVTIANPRAAELLGSALPSGDIVTDVSAPEWRRVWDWVVEFMRSSEEFAEEEFALGERQIRAQVAAMHADPKGCVIALDDTTELSRAVRVLAWGELARQVAHEIKNPLTPIRLGIQHIQRARRDGSAEFDSTLERTGQQILAEIERLDAIARAFARFGAPPAESAPLERSDVVSVAREAADLYAFGDGPEIRLEASDRVEALVRRDEVKEVLINLIENARDAQARLVVIGISDNGQERVTIRVRDDGSGITKEHMQQVFEPQFSTTSSGTGLGLAICKRLVEGWGGTIRVASEVGEGTEVTIALSGTKKAASVGGSPS